MTICLLRGPKSKLDWNADELPFRANESYSEISRRAINFNDTFLSTSVRFPRKVHNETWTLTEVWLKPKFAIRNSLNFGLKRRRIAVLTTMTSRLFYLDLLSIVMWRVTQLELTHRFYYPYFRHVIVLRASSHAVVPWPSYRRVGLPFMISTTPLNGNISWFYE